MELLLLAGNNIKCLPCLTQSHNDLEVEIITVFYLTEKEAET